MLCNIFRILTWIEFIVRIQLIEYRKANVQFEPYFIVLNHGKNITEELCLSNRIRWNRGKVQ